MSQIATQTDLTGVQRTVLATVPPSTRKAFKAVAQVQRVLEVEYAISPTRAYRAFVFLQEAGLIEITAGFCRRTAEGDRILLA